MSCLSELTCAVYVDGELAPEALHDVELHLVRCERCRGRVMAVREEAQLLARVLREEVAERVAPSREPVAAPPSPSLLLGFGGAVLVLAGIGTAVEGSGAGLPWTNPITALRGALDVVFMLRERAPGLFELAVALGATVSVSALATFALSALLRRLGGAALVALSLPLSIAAGEARALETFHGDRVVAAGERVQGTLLGHGERVRIEGVLAGDLFVAAETVSIPGLVEGNVWVVADEFELTGTVDGSLFVGAERVRVAGPVKGAVHLAGHSVELARDASVQRDAWLAAERARIEGSVDRDVHAAAEQLVLAGAVGRDVGAWAERVSVDAPAKLAGSLTLLLPREDALTVAAGARVEGETRVDTRRGRHHHDPWQRLSEPHFYVWLVIRVGAAFLTGLLLYAVLPGLFAGRFATARGFFRAAGLGLVALLVAPPLLALLGLTLVGLPLAVVGASVLLAAVYAAGIVVAARVGSVLVRGEPGSLRAFGLALLAGLFVLAVATNLPWVGGPVKVLALLAGLGMLADRVWTLRTRRTALFAPAARLGS